MLKKSHISNIEIYSDEWHQFRLGKFTSSRIHAIMGESLTEGFVTYVDQKVGEEMTGQTTAYDEEIEDENTAWGRQYEPEALKKFQVENKVNFLVTQKMISNPKSRFSSTPDAIWVHGESLDQTEYNVSTLEVKCPRKYHKFNKLFRCKTPQDLYKVSRPYYWQVLDQMDNCDSAVGYFACYHPLYPEWGQFRQIEFKKIDLWDDFKRLKQRKLLAEQKFHEFKAEFYQN
jgi:putative phage-type endonuclease